MIREIIITSDGSTSIHLPKLNESYHSKHGAIQEAYHVFIKNGIELISTQNIAVLEIGFGTGLNAFITFLENQKLNKNIEYVGVEAYPVLLSQSSKMNFVNILKAGKYNFCFDKMHKCTWEKKVLISKNFELIKRKQFFEEINDKNYFDIIYFDAFSYRVQPQLWNTTIFRQMYEALKINGILTTYAARGIIKRNMIEAGFSVEKLPGPPGKREMLRAKK